MTHAIERRSLLRNHPSRVDPTVNASAVVLVSSSQLPPVADSPVSWERDTKTLGLAPPLKAEDLVFVAGAHQAIQRLSAKRCSG